MLRQQRFHNLADGPVLGVIPIVGEGDRLQPGRFVAGAAARMVPARQQAVGGKPVALMLLARAVEQIVGMKQMAQPLAYRWIAAQCATRIEQQVIAAFFQPTFDGFFTFGRAFERQAAVWRFADFW